MPVRLLLLTLLWIIASLGPSAAQAADDLAEVTRLHHSGQTAAALQRADEVLAAKPRDAQMRFLKAVVLGESGRSAEAIDVLVKLTEDFPDLPEPYNNLAVLYSAAGNYAKARTALEQALQLNPGYATAHENLGDVYVALAAQSYSAAARFDRDRAGIAAKLALLRQVAATGAAPPASAAAAAAAANAH